MNEKLGKLLILGGFGLKTLLSGISFLGQLMFPHGTGMFFNILSILATLAIVAGFAVFFLVRPNLLDLAIGGLMALTALTPVLNILLLKYLALEQMIYNNILLIIGLAFITAMFLWAFKLRKKGNQLASFAVIGSVVLSFACGYMTLFISPVIVSLGTIASSAALAFAAYLDYNS